MRRRTVVRVVMPLLMLVGSLSLWMWARLYWVRLSGPTDSGYWHTRIELSNGRLCVGRDHPLGPTICSYAGDAAPNYVSQTHWRLWSFREWNSMRCEQEWGSTNCGFAWRFVLPLWIPLALSGTWVLWSGSWAWRNRIILGHCSSCRYDLRGLSSPVCPECGSPIIIPPERVEA